MVSGLIVPRSQYDVKRQPPVGYEVPASLKMFLAPVLIQIAKGHGFELQVTN